MNPIKELLGPTDLDEAVQSARYPKPQWMVNESIYDTTWLLAKVGFDRDFHIKNREDADKLRFDREVSPGEYLTESKWKPLLTDIQNSILYLDVTGKITRPRRVRDILCTTAHLFLHVNELRSAANKPAAMSFDQIRLDELTHYLLSFNVSRDIFDSTLQIIMRRWKSKKEINWNMLKEESGLTTRAFNSLKHKLIHYLKANNDSFDSELSYKRAYKNANCREFDIDFDLFPKEKTISNEISKLECLYTSRTAQLYKFQHSPMSLFSSGRTIFESMLEPEKTPLMPVNISLHALSSALKFARKYGAPLRQYLTDLSKCEYNKFLNLGISHSTSLRYSPELIKYAFQNTPIPEALTELNITSWTSKGNKFDSINDHSGMSACAAVILYTASIWILLASFTTGRTRSLQTLKRDCFQQSPIDELFDLVLKIPKSSERLELEELHRPIPDLIYDYGLEFAALASELEARKSIEESDRNSFLFGKILSYRSIATQRFNDTSVYKYPLGEDYINEALGLFQDWTDSPLLEGKRWYPSTHQFRRLFAVLYFNFSDQTGLEELSWFMGHSNLDQTFHYAEISPTDEWMEEAEFTIARIGANLAKSINGDETVKGIINKAREETSISLVLEQLVMKLIKKHKAETGQEVRFHKIEEEKVFFYFTDTKEEKNV